MNPELPGALPVQSASSILMVRPGAFGFDDQTAGTNPFQSVPAEGREPIEARAVEEFDRSVRALRGAGVQVTLLDDPADPRTPDAVFPNNWISTHPDGTVLLYPMLAPVRRLERRTDVVDLLTLEGFRVRRLIDLSSNEAAGRYLEGTGSLVFDHLNRTAYASLSPRTGRGMVAEALEILGYTGVIFHSTDASGQAVYHTNVVLSIGSQFAVVCGEAIESAMERRRVLETLARTGRTLLEITRSQMTAFSANVLELRSAENRPLLAASESAWAAFSASQREKLGHHADVVTVGIPTIESVGGGSLRCMIAEIFLPRRAA